MEGGTMTLPIELAYALAGGIALLILERVFTFIKWILKNNARKVHPEAMCNPYSLSDRQILEQLLTKSETATTAIGTLAVEMGVVKTKVEFLGEAQKKQNGFIDKLRIAYTEQMRVYNKRFRELEKGEE